MLEGEEDEGVKAKIQDFLNLSVLSVKHQRLSDMDGSLTLSLNHRTPAIRVNAIKHLLKHADKVRFTEVSHSQMRTALDTQSTVYYLLIFLFHKFFNCFTFSVILIMWLTF